MPYFEDEAFIAELAVVVHDGWDLPLEPQNWTKISRLLQLVDDSKIATYRRLAERLLRRLDMALEEAYSEERIGEDEWTGLRILVGLHPAYRDVASPTTRKAVASTYLVAGRRGVVAADAAHEWRMAESFRRKHQEKALRRVLACYLEAFGRPPEEVRRADDLLTIRHDYVVDDRRQVVLQRVTEVRQVIETGYQASAIWIPDPKQPGRQEPSFRLTQYPAGREVTVKGPIAFLDHPEAQLVVLEYDHPYTAGEILTYSFEVRCTYESEIEEWNQYYVATSENNDGYQLDMSVRFECKPPPQTTWAIEGTADMNKSYIEPDKGTLLILDADQVATFSWKATQRRIDYGIQWRWDEAAM